MRHFFLILQKGQGVDSLISLPATFWTEKAFNIEQIISILILLVNVF